MKTLFESQAWHHRRIAADPAVRGAETPITLKFGPDLRSSGRLQPRLLGAELQVPDLIPLRQRPAFLNEGVVQDYIWSSDRALSWLAGGEEAIVFWEPTYPVGAKRSDFLIETANSVILVELEKDGQGRARKDLSEQLAAAVASGLLGPETPKRIRLVALDVAATGQPETPPAVQADFTSLIWGLATRPEDKHALWITLYPSGQAAATHTRTPERHQYGPRYSDDGTTPYQVDVCRGLAVIPTGNDGSALQPVTMIRIDLYGQKHVRRNKVRLNTKGRGAETSAWMAEIAEAFYQALRPAGAICWETRQVTVITNDIGLVYFIDSSVEAVAAAIDQIFVAGARWPVPKGYLPAAS